MLIHPVANKALYFQWLKPEKFFKAVDYYKLFYRSDADVERGRDFSNFILMPEDKRPERVSLIGQRLQQEHIRHRFPTSSLSSESCTGTSGTL